VIRRRPATGCRNGRPGNASCRRRRHHHWERYDSVIYGRRAFNEADLKDLPIGTRINIIERCPSCKNKRQADHLVYERGRSRVRDPQTGKLVTEIDKGLRIVDERWMPIYGEVKNVPYLLDPGSQPLTIEMREELYAAEFFESPGRVSYVVEGDDAD
jgi:hypothetical protein